VEKEIGSGTFSTPPGIVYP